MDDSKPPQTEKRPAKKATSATKKGPALAADPEVDPARREKIERIKRAVADGTYRIDNDEVARKLIDHMREPKR